MKRKWNTEAGRDLYWALTSPMVMDHRCLVNSEWGQREVARFQGVLARLDQRGSALEQAVRRRRSHRLGEYFEVLIGSWLREVPPAKVLAANWQVFGGKGTIGEYDLLFERDGKVWHWELAIKFYLGYSDGTRERWYGPNPVDRLDQKWAKMRGQQLRLSGHPAGREALKKLHIRRPVEPRGFLKGYLFEALDQEYLAALPEDANPSGLRGFWVHRGRWGAHQQDLDRDGELRWARLSRLRWMAPVEGEERLGTQSFEGLGAILPEEEAAMVVGLRQGKEGWEEVYRGFVVPDGWPG